MNSKITLIGITEGEGSVRRFPKISTVVLIKIEHGDVFVLKY